MVVAVLAFALIVAISYGLLWALRAGLLSVRVETLDPPLSLEELAGVEDGRYVTEIQEDATLFLARREYYQHIHWDEARPGEGAPSLDYTVVDVHIPALQGWCERQLLHSRDDWGVEEWDGPYYQYVETDPAPWGAERAWQLQRVGEPTETWLLAWPGRLVELDAGLELTEAQMALAGEKLAP